MTFKKLTIVLPAVLMVAACASPDRFGSGNDVSAPAPAPVTTPSIVPGSAQDPRSPLYFQQTVGDRVLFSVDQSSLTDEAKRILDGQAAWLVNNPEYDVVIEGHADEQGTREYNLALGARRANAVKEYLLAKGLPSSRLKTLTYGKERPLEVCSQEACYAKNRRAVTILSGSLTS